MRIDELDEYQETTKEQLFAWMRANNHAEQTDTDSAIWDRFGGFGLDVAISAPGALPVAVCALSQMTGKSPQTLLREINPRMRKGMPSDAALAEHDEWIVCTPFGATFIAEISYGGSDDGFSIMMPPINDHCDAEFIAEKHWPECLFWPCDQHGNKVRWPTDADGNML